MTGIGYTPDPRTPDPITKGQHTYHDEHERDGTELMPGRFPTSPKQTPTEYAKRHDPKLYPDPDSANSSNWSDQTKQAELSPHPGGLSAPPASSPPTSSATSNSSNLTDTVATTNGTLIDQSTEGLDLSNQLHDAHQGMESMGGGDKIHSEFSEDVWGVEKGAGRDSLNG